jgi:hypothetical protein
MIFAQIILLPLVIALVLMLDLIQLRLRLKGRVRDPRIS